VGRRAHITKKEFQSLQKFAHRLSLSLARARAKNTTPRQPPDRPASAPGPSARPPARAPPLSRSRAHASDSVAAASRRPALLLPRMRSAALSRFDRVKGAARRLKNKEYAGPNVMPARRLTEKGGQSVRMRTTPGCVWPSEVLAGAALLKRRGGEGTKKTRRCCLYPAFVFCSLFPLLLLSTRRAVAPIDPATFAETPHQFPCARARTEQRHDHTPSALSSLRHRRFVF